MNYQEIAPHPALARQVRCFWILEHGSSAADSIFPDGSMELVFNFGEPFRELRNGYAPALQPRSFVVGQMKRPICVQPSGPAGIVGVRFYPGGSYSFFRFPQRELAGQVTGLDLIWGEAVRELQQRVLEAANNPTRVRLVESFLLARRGDVSQPLVEAAVQRIVAAEGVLSIRHLARQLGWSERQLLRCFYKFVGLNPKLLARLRRFHRMLKALNGPRWADAALEAGYSDQAHFIREFREFSGQTPSHYLSRSHPLSDYFV